MVGISGGMDSPLLPESWTDRVSHLPLKVQLLVCHIKTKIAENKVDMFI